MNQVAINFGQTSSPRKAGIPTAISADLMRGPSRGLSALLLTLIAMVAMFILWSAFAKREEVTTGQGRVIPASKIQIVQNLEGGIVRAIHVRDGAMVTEGDVILRIDPTLSGAPLGEAREKMLGLKALIARLQAEVDDRPLVFPPEIAERPDVVSQQHDQYETRKRELDAALRALELQEKQRAQEIIELKGKIETLSVGLKLTEEEFALVRPLEKTKAASRSEILQLEGKVNDIRGGLRAAELALPRVDAAMREAQDRRLEKVNGFRGESLQKLSAARVELLSLSEASRSGQDKFDRTTVRAPVTGIVKTVHVTTAGQVVQPGSSLVEIVPLNDTLLIEAQIRPQDIGFLHPGQEAIVRLTAYDFSIYGGLKGYVEQIGADSITTEKGETHYIVRIRTTVSTLQKGTTVLPIIPGMIAEVDVITGSKTILTYLTKPFTRMRDTAMRER